MQALIDAHLQSTPLPTKLHVAHRHLSIAADTPSLLRAATGSPIGSLAVIMRPGLAIIGLGTAAAEFSTDPAGFRARLRTALVAGGTGAHGSCVLGLVPFDPVSLPSIMVLPKVVLRVAGQSVLVSAVASTPEEAAALLEDGCQIAAAATSGPPSGRPGPQLGELDFTETEGTWLAKADRAISMIRSGRFEKLVLSRRARVHLPEETDRCQSLARLASMYPGALTFSFLHLLGATPELLLRKAGDSFESHPLAGTAPAGAEAQLLRSGKDNHEHRVVVSHIESRLSPFTQRLEASGLPSITSFGPICHLGTPIKGILAEGGQTSSLDLLLAIHPTPAVAGVPQRQAIDAIQEIEDEPRHYYAGAIGFEDVDGDGEWHLVIRTVAIGDHEAEFQAGVGLVAESEPDSESAEVKAKLASMRPIVAG